MKNSLFVAFGVLLGVGIGLGGGWAIWGNHNLNKAPIAENMAPQGPTPFNPNSALNPNRPVQIDWQALRVAREKALHDHPDLNAEYNSLLHEAENEKREMNAAMIKANPKIAAILVKLGELQTSAPHNH